MLEALKTSTEPEHVRVEARRYLRGLKGSLVRNKKEKDAKRAAELARQVPQGLHGTDPATGLT